MGRCRVVTPEIVRLELSDGDFINVKKELNAGEYLDLIEALGARQHFARVLAYVTEWSLVGIDGQPLPYSVNLPEDLRRSTVASQDAQTVIEIIAALDRHVAAADAKKKTGTGSSLTSTSPVGITGDTSGSSN